MDSKELKNEFRKLPPLYGNTYWHRQRRALREQAVDSDPRKFLTWSTLHATMYVGCTPFVLQEWEEMSKAARYWRDVIALPEVGGEKSFVTPCAQVASTNLIHQAYHIYRFQKATHKNLKSYGDIVEIGGGYGAMALVARRLHFPGTYIIFDTPEAGLIQRYFITNMAVWFNTVCTSYHLKSWMKEYHSSLVIACWSLSEMQTNLASRLFDITQGAGYLIVYQTKWMGRDNHQMMREFTQRRPDLRWSIHKAVAPDAFYLFGVQRDD